MERVTGIEPASSDWQSNILAVELYSQYKIIFKHNHVDENHFNTAIKTQNPPEKIIKQEFKGFLKSPCDKQLKGKQKWEQDKEEKLEVLIFCFGQESKDKKTA